ncbi:hypothetical protein FHT86_000854 [Rhizobium sp. BK313]|nr:hypothetical protein [Rhizobium sp. BK313]MBB3452598.1 hypothetical protein [Rhizobium sp. BK313]
MIGHLRFVIENFFELVGRKLHEVGFYYEAELAKPLPFHETDIVHRVRDGSADLEFRWAFPRKAVLDQFDLMPLPLRALIETMPSGVQHVVRRNAVS